VSAEQKALAIADKIVPAYRDGGRRYSCTGNVAKMWQAAYDGALSIAVEVAQSAAKEVPSTVRRIVGPTILLVNGTYFDFLDPESAAFDIEDVAHGLSHICRFAGQCRKFYSVAEHSVYVSFLVPEEYALAALLHDAAEAFVGDVAKPLKDLLPEYKAIEDRVETMVLGRFGLSKPLHPSIKEADIIMLATEQRALMRNDDDWHYTHGRQPADIEIKAMPPAEARAFFLVRFRELIETSAEGAG
jgi:5'-deoxynucleotidase YfbR-like HD superfamily hydrolase